MLFRLVVKVAFQPEEPQRLQEVQPFYLHIYMYHKVLEQVIINPKIGVLSRDITATKNGLFKPSQAQFNVVKYQQYDKFLSVNEWICKKRSCVQTELLLAFQNRLFQGLLVFLAVLFLSL